MGRFSPLTLALLMLALGCMGDPAGGDDTTGGDDTAGSGDSDTGGDDTPEAAALPIEILGPAGTAVAVRIDVPQDLADAPAAELALTVHNVLEAGAAFVVVGDAEPIDLGAPALRLVRPSGGHATASLALPDGTLRAGENRVVFRYDREIRDVSGFRVLDVALVVGGQRLATGLPADDPATWTAPSADANAIARGERFFTAESRDGGPPCARCHADDGADLAYFAFSNHSLIARAEHHLFSAEEAADIASYIRSLPVAAVGRVFDPPFQPGPAHVGAAGAGYDAVLPADDALGAALFPDGFPDAPAWDIAASFDTSTVALPVELPSWSRWLPRKIDATWFTRGDGALAVAEAALASDGSLEAARAFATAAVHLGKEILITTGDHAGRVELLRYAAVKLWDWQRRHGGFEGADHGFPDGGPAFPYEVGFAFFEAAFVNGLPDAMDQAFSWWMAQAAVNPGRGQTTGDRPLNWRDVLTVADSAGAGPWTLTYLHLVGSLEESQGALADDFGTDRGPVRLLAVPLRRVAGPVRAALMRRFLTREAAFLAGGGSLTSEHHVVLGNAWRDGCDGLTPDERAELRALAPSEVAADLAACP
ncbi:hypothetical protein [Nannocystis exedens]|uniref:hypothetical protein n=1 Tax=Nannocystis exedens TaxID=54 RepID=UPI001160B34E|nr:hypothetical protein [Nannocystis exedens]